MWSRYSLLIWALSSFSVICAPLDQKTLPVASNFAAKNISENDLRSLYNLFLTLRGTSSGSGQVQRGDTEQYPETEVAIENFLEHFRQLLITLAKNRKLQVSQNLQPVQGSQQPVLPDPQNLERLTFLELLSSLFQGQLTSNSQSNAAVTEAQGTINQNVNAQNTVQQSQTQIGSEASQTNIGNQQQISQTSQSQVQNQAVENSFQNNQVSQSENQGLSQSTVVNQALSSNFQQNQVSQVAGNSQSSTAQQNQASSQFVGFGQVSNENNQAVPLPVVQNTIPQQNQAVPEFVQSSQVQNNILNTQSAASVNLNDQFSQSASQGQILNTDNQASIDQIQPLVQNENLAANQVSGNQQSQTVSQESQFTNTEVNSNGVLVQGNSQNVIQTPAVPVASNPITVLPQTGPQGPVLSQNINYVQQGQSQIETVGSQASVQQDVDQLPQITGSQTQSENSFQQNQGSQFESFQQNEESSQNVGVGQQNQESSQLPQLSQVTQNTDSEQVFQQTQDLSKNSLKQVLTALNKQGFLSSHQLGTNQIQGNNQVILNKNKLQGVSSSGQLLSGTQSVSNNQNQQQSLLNNQHIAAGQQGLLSTQQGVSSSGQLLSGSQSVSNTQNQHQGVFDNQQILSTGRQGFSSSQQGALSLSQIPAGSQSGSSFLNQQGFLNNQQMVSAAQLGLSSGQEVPPPGQFVNSHVYGGQDQNVVDLKTFQQQAANAHYQFASKVDNNIEGNYLYRQESRDGTKVTGSYSYDDGYYWRTVNYVADENGFRVVKETVTPSSKTRNLNGRATVQTNINGNGVSYQISRSVPFWRRRNAAVKV